MGYAPVLKDDRPGASHPAIAAAAEASRGLPPRLRARSTVRGAVQGVGFRPFVYRLATDGGLTGWVTNTGQGVLVEVEGTAAAVREFLLRLERDRPPRSFIQSLETVYLDPAGYDEFAILPSEVGGETSAVVMPDLATCSDCLRELFDPGDRRFGYPFINCTNCGPRFSILEALPYDRPNTSMKGFPMCVECATEYADPRNRRFHAQPNACPACGPHVELWDPTGRQVASRGAAVSQAAEAVRAGAIVAVKGLGGFHLLVLAGVDAAVRRLRDRKHREEKPLALMFPTLDAARACCQVSVEEDRLLRAPEAPIVLLRRQKEGCGLERGTEVSPLVAPGNPYWGVMLPYTPLHHLLLAALGRPVVATSANLSDEPICTEPAEALERLRGIADLFLVHDRPIVRHVDDSIVRVVLGRELVLRRARGFAPLPVALRESARPTLAVGAHLKNAVAVASGRQVFLSQHIGDLESLRAFQAFERVIRDLARLYALKPEVVAADDHPDYLSTKFARKSTLPLVTVQHHYAHVLSCMAENELSSPVLGVAWDGTGYGLDDTIWGGEFLRVTDGGFERAGHLRTFRLPGGEKAVKEPRRTGLGLLYEMFGAEALEKNDLAPVQAFSPAELRTLRRMLAGDVRCPRTSSVGRLFDAVASLAGLRQRVGFEGQAAMDLEFALEPGETEEAYPLAITRMEPGPGEQSGPEQEKPAHPPATPVVVDWAPLVREILKDLRYGVPVWEISAKFHNALAECIVTVAREVGEPRVVLSGGCFQNKYLLERAAHYLRSEGFKPYWHQRVPTNDGGIALGQVAAAMRSSSFPKRTCA